MSCSNERRARPREGRRGRRPLRSSALRPAVSSPGRSQRRDASPPCIGPVVPLPRAIRVCRRCAEVRRIAQMEALRRGTGDGRMGDLGGVTVAPQVEIPRSREIAREITPPERAGRSTVHHAAPTVHAAPRVATKLPPSPASSSSAAGAAAKRGLAAMSAAAPRTAAASGRPSGAPPPGRSASAPAPVTTSTAFAGVLPSGYAEGAICVQPPPAKRCKT